MPNQNDSATSSFYSIILSEISKPFELFYRRRILPDRASFLAQNFSYYLL